MATQNVMSAQNVLPDQNLSSAQVEILSPQEKVEMADEWYDIAAADHFWFQWRFAKLSRLLRDVPLGQRVLEVGCGNAIARDQFEEHYGQAVDGCDLSLSALQMARPGRGKLYLYNIHDRREDWKGHFDTILMLDVIEHIDDVPGFLRSAAFHLRPQGQLVVNVPALQFLYGCYDRHVGHQRRYNKRVLCHELEAGGFQLVRAGYWGLTMVPVLFLRELLLRFTSPQQTVARGFQPSRASDVVVRSLMHVERTLLPSPFVGSSLVALARKAD